VTADDVRALLAVQERSYASAGGAILHSWPPEAAMDERTLAEFLEPVRYGVLATTRPDRRPQAAPVGYVVDGGELWFASVAGARVRNLRAMPYASFVVADGTGREHRALTVEGPVTVHEATDELHVRFDPLWVERFATALRAWASVFIELQPERVFSHDASS